MSSDENTFETGIESKICDDAITAAMSVIAACNTIRCLDVSLRQLAVALEYMGFGRDELVSAAMIVSAGSHFQDEGLLDAIFQAIENTNDESEKNHG